MHAAGDDPISPHSVDSPLEFCRMTLTPIWVSVLREGEAKRNRTEAKGKPLVWAAPLFKDTPYFEGRLQPTTILLSDPGPGLGRVDGIHGSLLS